MPTSVSYPGVYIEEVPSGVRTIAGVATSITAFVGRAPRGPVDRPVRVRSLGEYGRVFGGLDRASTMSYAVQQFFLNGGNDALIVRVTHGDTAARFVLATQAGGNLDLEAANPGPWGNNLRVLVSHAISPETPSAETNATFNLEVRELSADGKDVVNVELFRNVSVDTASPRYVGGVLEQQSKLIALSNPQPDPPAAERPNPIAAVATPSEPTSRGADGGALEADDIAPNNPDSRQGIYALEHADLFNLMVLPPLTFGDGDMGHGQTTWERAAKYCLDRRAILIVDPPADWTAASSVTMSAINGLMERSRNAALYFPRLRAADPLRENQLRDFVPSGAVAGVIARTDAERGVWKAPAGIEATLRGVAAFTVPLTDGENGDLNPLGVNCLRSFPVPGRVVWGARTLRGADALADDWKYLPVRRLALFIEESLFRGTQWVVFEPNDEPLWSQIRLNLGAFMQNLFRQGAFQGSTPREAYFVKCDSETTTQADINLGIVNIHVGFAPLKPAEFVVIRIQQMAGQIQA